MSPRIGRVVLRIAFFASAAVLAALAAQMVFAQSTPQSAQRPPDPDAGLTAEEKIARHTANTEEYKRRFRVWLDDFAENGPSLWSLERRPADSGRPR